MLLLTREDEKFAEGFHEWENKANERVAVNMLQDGEPLAKISRYSQLAENVVRNLATSLGLSSKLCMKIFLGYFRKTSRVPYVEMALNW